MSKRKISIILCIVFLLAGCVLIFLYFSEGLSLYTSVLSGSMRLVYFPMISFGGLSLFAGGILFLVLFLFEKRCCLNNKIFTVLTVLILVSLCAFNAVNVVRNYIDFDEMEYYRDMDLEYDMQLPDKSIAKFFPYFSDMEKIAQDADETAIYSLYKQELGNTVYEMTQVFCSDCAFTAEYFTTDNSFLSGKFISEKSFHFTTGENGEALDSSAIKHKTYGEMEYDIIEQSTQKTILINGGEYYFLFEYRDSANVLNLSTEDFTALAFEQLNYLKEFSQAQQ